MTKSNQNIHVLADETLGGIKREYVEVKRKAKIGEKVIIVDANVQDEDPYDNGDIFKVEKKYGLSETARTKCNRFILDTEYHVLEPTNIVHIDGQRYEMVDRNAKVGEKIISITKSDIYSKGEIGTVGHQSPPHYIYVRFETRPLARRVSHEDYLVLVPLDKHEKMHKNKNSGYKEMKNLIHNELGITRQEIQEMISVAISNEVQKLFESGKLDIIVGAKIDSLIEEGFRNGGRFCMALRKGYRKQFSMR